MIKSILGGKSKNLFDISKAITSNVVKRNGNSLICSVYGTSIGTLESLCPTLKANDTITISFKCTSQGAASNFMNIGDNHIFRSGSTFIASELGLSSPVYLYNTDYAHRDIPNKTTYSDIQVELGSTATEYVPYELTSYKSIMKVSDVCQLVDKNKIPTTRTISGVTFTNNGDGSVTVNGTSTHQYYSEIVIPIDGSLFIPGHVYLNGTIAGNFAGFVALSGPVAKDYLMAPQYIYTLPSGKDFNKFRYIIRVRTGATANDYKCTPQPFDLTKMFGAGNEPKTVAEFKAKFPNDYYPYSPSCFVTSYDERMPCKTKNLFDKSKADVISREYYFTLNQGVGSNFYVMNVKPGTTYTVTYERFIKLFDTTAGNAVELSIQTGTHYKDGTQLLIRSANGKIGVWGKRSGQFTVPSDINQVTFSGLKDRFLYHNFMVQEGTTATDYVPYGYV